MLTETSIQKAGSPSGILYFSSCFQVSWSEQAVSSFLTGIVVSRIVAIDNFVEKVGKDEAFSTHCIMEGDDELSRLTEGINRLLDRLKINSDIVKAQEHEKNAILNSLSEFVIFMDPGLRIVWANRASLDYAGLKLENIIGHRYGEFFPMSSDAPGKSLAQKALESGNDGLGEVFTPDGKLWVIRANLIKD